MIEDIEAVIEIAAPPERVWAALAGAQRKAVWDPLRFQLRVGHLFYMQPDAERRAAGDIGGATECRVEHVEPPRRLAFSWRFPDAPPTQVAIVLSKIPGGTHVKLLHQGWAKLEGAGARAGRDELEAAWSGYVLPALKAAVEA